MQWYGIWEEARMKRAKRISSAILISVAAGIFIVSPAAAQTASYEGKTLRMIIPSGD